MNDPIAAPDAVIDMAKRGESCISMTFRRSMNGLTLTVKTHPLVEEFFRNISTGENVDVRNVGRHWTGLQKDQPLMAYNLAEPIPFIHLDGAKRVRFDRLATHLVSPIGGGGDDGGLRAAPATAGGGREQDVNLGFLRLVGIGDGTGVTFTIRGVFSEKSVQDMRDAVAEGAKRFYQAYMKPLNMNISIVSSEW